MGRRYFIPFCTITICCKLAVKLTPQDIEAVPSTCCAFPPSLFHIVFRLLGAEWMGKKNVLYCLNVGHAGTDTPVSYATDRTYSYYSAEKDVGIYFRCAHRCLTLSYKHALVYITIPSVDPHNST